MKRKEKMKLPHLPLGLLIVKLCFLWKLAEGKDFACSSPLGVESQAIADIKASSQKVGDGPSQANIHGDKGWCSQRTDKSQYIEVNFGSVKIVSGVATKGHGTKASWVKSYRINYSLDGVKWFSYNKRYDNTIPLFQANADNNNTVISNLEEHLVAQYIRINPRSWMNAICMRLEILGCSADCDTWMGMAYEEGTPAIPDSALSASSLYSDSYTAVQGRLFKENHHSPTGLGAWIPAANNANEYLQVDLGLVTQVSGFVTMGRTIRSDWVTGFYLSHSTDNKNWKYVMDGSSKKVFPGNSNMQTSVRVNKLSPPVYARYVRLHGKSYYSYIAVRAEIIGCKQAGRRDIGMTSLEIPNDRVTASTYYSGYYRPYYARLGVKMGNGAWICSYYHKNVNQYLQVYFGSAPVPVTGVATQGRYNVAQYVTLLKLEFSNNTDSWEPYKENGEEKIFPRGTDSDLVERVNLDRFVLAKYIRFRAKSWNGYVAFRVEIYGFRGPAPQIFDHSPGNLSLYENDDVTLRCQAVGDGSIQIKWYKEGTLLQTRSSTDNPDLLIANLKSSDSGGYRCEASSSHGTDSYSVHLTVHQAEDPYVMCASPVVLDDPTRTPENREVANVTDDTFIRPEKWYAFSAGPANEIPVECITSKSCGGQSPGWLFRATPSIEEGVVDTKICFTSSIHCCSSSAKVLVRRCHGYVVYKFYEGIPTSIDARVCVSKSVASSTGRNPRILAIAAGYGLVGFPDATHTNVPSVTKCTVFCMNSPRCLSFNYSQAKNICELKTTTKSRQPTAFGPRPEFVHYEKVIPD